MPGEPSTGVADRMRAKATARGARWPSRTDPGRPRPIVRIVLVWSLALAASAAFLTVGIQGPMEFALARRATVLGAMVVAAFAHGVGTVLFHTATGNRILTPSIIGFDAMYTLMQTLTVFAFGATAIATSESIAKLLTQTALMVVAATVLYGWLLAGERSSVMLLLLVGVVLGLAFDSVSSFVQRLLSPTEHDMLSIELLGRISQVEPDYLPLALAVCAIVGTVVWLRRRRLDVLLLGRDQAVTLGVHHRTELIVALALVALLIAFATALIGPMTFFGFLVATLAYRLVGDYRHAFVLPFAWGLGVLALVLAQLVMEHVLDANGLLTVIIEVIGGVVFLVLLITSRRSL